LSGSIIGAGILGLPYAFSRSGFFVGMLWTLFLASIIIYLNLALGEVSLRTKGRHHLIGYAEKYLGKAGKRIMFFAIFFEIYSALIAYMIGEGQSLSKLFTGGTEFAILFGVIFWFLLTVFVYGSVKRLEKVEYFGVSFMLVTLVVILIMLSPSIHISNLTTFDSSQMFYPFGIVLFALMGFTAIPNVREELLRNRKSMKRTIIFGTLIPVLVYLLFSFVFVGVLGGNIAEVATNSFSGFIGKLLILLGVLTMLTSFFVLSFALRDIVDSDLREKKFAFVIVSAIPLALYLIVSIFNIAGFAGVLGIGGAVAGGALGILVMLLNIRAKKEGDVKSEYKIPINWIIIIILSLIFIAGIIVQIFM
jgi:tyrosine-specific transport protein